MRPINKLNFLSNLVFATALWLVCEIASGQTKLELPSANAIQKPSVKTADWNQWRGPDRDGKLSGLELPASLDDQQMRKVWSIPLEPSYSGPLVVGDRVYTTQTIDKKFEAVTAHDRKTGQQLWEKQWEGAMSVPFFAKANGDWIRATPAYNEGKLYVAGMRDKLVCLNADNGDIVWDLDFPKTMKSKVPAFGYVSSPLVDGDAVYTQAGQAIFKLNKLTGEVVWEAGKNGGGMDSAFSSPMIATLAGKRHGGQTKLFKLVGTDNGFELQQQWTLPAQGYMCTPVVVDGHAYTHLRNQRFACYDLKNGVEKWKTKKFGKYASLVVVGDKILALDENGWLMLLKINPEAFELLGKRKVGTDTWAHLALQGNQVFIRGLEELSMYQWE